MIRYKGFMNLSKARTVAEFVWVVVNIYAVIAKRVEERRTNKNKFKKLEDENAALKKRLNAKKKRNE